MKIYVNLFQAPTGTRFKVQGARRKLQYSGLKTIVGLNKQISLVIERLTGWPINNLHRTPCALYPAPCTGL